MGTTTAPQRLTPILPTMQTEPSTYTPVPGAMLTGIISENVNGTVEVLLFVIYIFMVMVTVQPWVIHDVLNIG